MDIGNIKVNLARAPSVKLCRCMLCDILIGCSMILGVKEEPVAEEDKSKPDYGLSGKLADDTNTFRGIVVKYNEPPEARKPKLKWRLYPFKGLLATNPYNDVCVFHF